MDIPQNKIGLVEIALVSAALGACGGGALVLMVLWPQGWYGWSHLIVMVVFHLNEFDCTYRYQRSKVTSRLFLVYGNTGSRELWAVQVATAAEYGLRPWVGVTMARGSVCTAVGTTLVVVGLVLRRAAMKTCGESFSHYINTETVSPLVTTGVYLVMRHPSYVGFFVFVVGTQLMLRNAVMVWVCAVVMGVFFRRRIRFEEWFLQRQHPAYTEYQRRVPSIL